MHICSQNFTPQCQSIFMSNSFSYARRFEATVVQFQTKYFEVTIFIHRYNNLSSQLFFGILLDY